jgi:hypothetical protein
MLLNRSSVWGNGTLFNGTTVETTEASGNLALTNGVRIQLGAQSKASVFENRAVLEKGAAQVSGNDVFLVEAPGLKIAGAGMRVVFVGPGVEVASLRGTTNVRGENGVLMAAIPAGGVLSFAFQQNATRTGCLVYKMDHFLLQDDNTSEVLELSGSGLSANVGNHVDVTGSITTTRPVVSPATVVMSVSGVTLKAAGGCLTVASSLSASATPPTTAPATTTPGPASAGGAAKAGGLSTGAKVGIAVAVAGGAAGAAIAASSGKKGSTSP